MAKSAYETSIDYGKETAATVADTFIPNGLGDRLFDIPTIRMAQSTLAALLTNAYTSGMMEALRRLSPPVEDPHPTAAKDPHPGYQHAFKDGHCAYKGCTAGGGQ